MDGIKTAMQQINELSKKVDSGDENLQNQINELPKKIQNRIVQLEDENRKLKHQNG